MYANLKYFCVTPSLSESHVWNHRNYGGGVQLDFVTSFCREYGATPGCAADAVGQKRNQNCRTGAAPEGGEYALGRKFSAFSGHFSAPNTSAELCFTYWRISAVFWKAGLWVSLVMCTRLFAFVICASITLALKGKRTCYVHLDRGFSSPPWHWHWKASAPSNPTCRQHHIQRFSSSEILLHSPC